MGLSFFELMHTVFVFRDLPGDVLAATESALGLDRCNTSLPPSNTAANMEICSIRGQSPLGGGSQIEQT